MKLFEKISRSINRVEADNNFQPAWYAIFFKPLFITRRALFLSILKFSKSVINKKILDVGCGEAPYRNLFESCEYIGIDVEGASHDDNLKKTDIFFNGTDIPFPDDTFDMVILSEVLEHVENADRIISEISRVLKKTGVLYLTIPFVWDEHAIPYDFRRLTTFGLRQILSENHLEATDIQKTSGIFGAVGQLISSFLFDFAFRNLKLIYRIKYIFQKLFTLFICFPVQSICLLLDYVFGKKGITVGYVVIAKKI